MNETTIWYMAIGTVLIILAAQKWFWFLALLLGAITAGFYALAHLFHFQILYAMGCAFVSFVCMGILAFVVDLD